MKKLRFLFAHGAGAPSSSEWMRRYATNLGKLGDVTTFDYPYMQRGRRTPDPLPKLIEAHRAALKALPSSKSAVLIGKSMGGRVGCHLALEEPVRAVICLGYPLKAPGKSRLRDEVLLKLRTPILFVQGTRDSLCPLDDLEQVRRRMSAPNELHVVDSGNHSLEATRKHLSASEITQADVESDLLAAVERFLERFR